MKIKKYMRTALSQLPATMTMIGILLSVWIAYALLRPHVVRPLIASLYNQDTAFSFLNSVITSQTIHTLDHFYVQADMLFIRLYFLLGTIVLLLASCVLPRRVNLLKLNPILFIVVLFMFH